MAESCPKSKCCTVKTMCGRNLCSGVVYVSVCTITVTIISLVLAVSNVTMIACSESQLNSQPRLAVDLLFGLMVASVSVYQLVITALLLWQAVKTKGKIYLCSLWYVSHLSILALYGMMFFARIAVSVAEKRNFTACITIVAGIAYEGVFIYFTIVVNSFLHSLDHERYF